MIMPGLLADALQQSALRLGIDTEEAAARVVRVDVHPERGVVIELDCRRDSDPAGSRWFRFDGTSTRELSPHEDRRLPLCATLARDAAPIAWRPQRRVVVDGGGSGTIVKGYRAGRAEAMRAAHALAHAALGEAPGVLSPAVAAVDHSMSALRLERLDGHPIVIAPESAELFYELGVGLTVLQRTLVDAPLPRFTVEDELAVLRAWREKALLACASLPENWDALARAALDAAEALPAGELVGAHRDLHDGQLLDVAGRVGVIDFDLACRADALIDPANLLAHLELRLLQGLCGATRTGVDHCAEALLEGLDGIHGDAWPRLRFYQATAFLRIALVYSVRPRWQHLQGDLVTFAKRCLEDLVRIA